MRVPQIKTIIAVAGVAIGVLGFAYDAGGTTAEYKHVINDHSGRIEKLESGHSEIIELQKDVSVIRNDVQWISAGEFYGWQS